MPRIVRKAEVGWDGTTSRGSGTVVATSSGSFELPFTLASRIAVTEGKTSPEELLAAASAACYATSLATELARAGTPPERIDVHATCVMDEVEGKGHQIVAMELDVSARAPGTDAAALEEAARLANEGCPFSSLLRASASVTVRAKLAAA